MIVKISASTLSGSVTAPTSKSAMQRYIAGALLAEGLSTIEAASLCEDSEAALSIAGALGAEVNSAVNPITIKGGFNPVVNEIFCGESGLSARMFTPIAALHDREIRVNGRGSLLKRPFEMAESSLSALGAEVKSTSGYLPLSVRGPLRGGHIIADGSLSSQFITGLLMALPLANKDSVISVKKLVSRPYIELTLKVLDEFGIRIVNEEFKTFHIKGLQNFKPGNFIAEGDWSGAAFLMVMGAIGGKSEVNGLDLKSVQADRAVLKALIAAGANVIQAKDSVSVTGGNLKGFEFDISDCPDLAPPLTVLGLACKGKTILKGAGRLALKESSRGETLAECMQAIGGKVQNFGDHLEIVGVGKLIGGAAESFNDHRIAMALASVSVLCKNPVVVNGMECINKSYPGFIGDLKKLGALTEIL